jgi:hypothetical protein
MGTSDAIVEVTDVNFEEEIEQVDGLHMIDFWAVHQPVRSLPQSSRQSLQQSHHWSPFTSPCQFG